jgi:hypothetical protein
MVHLSLETTLLSSLDSRVKDTFRFERVELGDYDASELGSILSDRCRVGLKDTAYDLGIVAMIARLAYERGLRVRGVYSNAGLSIRPKAQTSKIDMVKEFVRGLGLNLEDALTEMHLLSPHRIFATNQEREDDQIRALSRAFMDNLKKELSLR